MRCNLVILGLRFGDIHGGIKLLLHNDSWLFVGLWSGARCGPIHVSRRHWITEIEPSLWLLLLGFGWLNDYTIEVIVKLTRISVLCDPEAHVEIRKGVSGKHRWARLFLHSSHVVVVRHVGLEYGAAAGLLLATSCIFSGDYLCQEINFVAVRNSFELLWELRALLGKAFSFISFILTFFDLLLILIALAA